jgi:type II secretory pathway predicted ATPase ExeA
MAVFNPESQMELAESQQTSLARLRDVLRRGGLAVLCGPSGTGKTMLVTRLAAEVNATPGWAVHGPCGVRTLRQQAAGRAAALRPAGSRVLTIVDDAHKTDDGAELAEVVEAGLVQQAHAAVVLVGEGRLLTLLARQPDLEQRVDLRAPLKPWGLQDTRQLTNRLLPGFGGMPDADSLCLRIHELAAGIPRQLMRLIETVAMVRSAEPKHLVTVDDLETFYRRLFVQAA